MVVTEIGKSSDAYFKNEMNLSLGFNSCRVKEDVRQLKNSIKTDE